METFLVVLGTNNCSYLKKLILSYELSSTLGKHKLPESAITYHQSGYLSRNVHQYKWIKSFRRMINTDPHISPSSEHRKPKQSAQKDLRVPRVWFIENDCKLKNSGEKLQNTGITPSRTTMSSDRDSSVQCWERHHWERADIISCEPTSAFGALSTRAVDVWGRRPSSNFKDGR